MRILSAALAALACALTSPARAAGAEGELGADVTADEAKANETGESSAPGSRPESGFQHALRLGLSLPGGVSSEGRSLSADVDRRVAVIADIGYRLSPHWYVGVMGMLGLDRAPNNCGLAGQAVNATCTIEGWRFGLEVFAHPFGRSRFDLWLGGGISWEKLEEMAVVPPPDPMAEFGTTLRSSQQGPALDLAAGVDFPVATKLAAGPFVGYTGGIYLTRDTLCPVTSSCPRDTIEEKGLHHWLTLGAHGIFGP